MGQLDGKIAMVTVRSEHGLGRAIAQFADEGADLILTDGSRRACACRRRWPVARGGIEGSRTIPQKGRRVMTALDVRSASEIAKVVSEALGSSASTT
jgi:NAD(P)-dependent dehydrogenase (short-subunit alcohol dehydrogenase family)